MFTFNCYHAACNWHDLNLIFLRENQPISFTLFMCLHLQHVQSQSNIYSQSTQKTKYAMSFLGTYLHICSKRVRTTAKSTWCSICNIWKVQWWTFSQIQIDIQFHHHRKRQMYSIKLSDDNRKKRHKFVALWWL